MTPVVAPVMRTRCCYCPVPHPTDGRGPIVAGELVSDGLCALALAKLTRELDALDLMKAGS